MPAYADQDVTLYAGDCIEVLRELPAASVDAVVTDPPYGLEFMGKDWDSPWRSGSDINADAGFNGGGISVTKNAPSFTGSTNPKCLNCKGTLRGRRDGTALVAVCVCDRPAFPNVRATEMRAFQAWCQQWAAECYRVLKPGGHLFAFGGTRTVHRLTCGIEDAEFEIRDGLVWLYSTGFPKSLNVSRAIDKSSGTERIAGAREWNGGQRASGILGDNLGTQTRVIYDAPATDAAKQWQGWGTALKPAHEPIVVARKPLMGTVAQNVIAYGTGALNIDATRVGTAEDKNWPRTRGYGHFNTTGSPRTQTVPPTTVGRWPANVVLSHSAGCEEVGTRKVRTGNSNLGVVHGTGNGATYWRAPRRSGAHHADPDGTETIAAWRCVEGCAVAELDRQSGQSTAGVPRTDRGSGGIWQPGTGVPVGPQYGDTGGASRFFPTFRYEAKAPSAERPRDDATSHPTVKPLDLMRWLVRLVTPRGAVVLDPFAGSGTTVEACLLESRRCIAIEKEPTYLPLILQRLAKPVQQELEF